MFMGFSLEFLVHSISPLSVEVFSLNFNEMLISVRHCAEILNQLCRLNILE